MRIIIGPLSMENEPEPKTFQEFNEETVRDTWRGVGCTDELPGGGNADNDGDRDTIEQQSHPKAKIVGPEGLLPEGNSK